MTVHRILCLLPVLLASLAGPCEAIEIGALGRILPEGGIATLVGPPMLTIEKILVKPEQVVSAGDPLIVFTGKKTLEIELALARQHRADVEKSGTRAIEIQQATLARLRTGAARAIEVQKLREQGAKEAADYAASVLSRLMQSQAATYSANTKAELEHQLSSARIALQAARAETSNHEGKIEAEANLAELELGRLKLELAARIQEADLKITLVEDKLAQATLRAPSDGTILEVLRMVGEVAGGPLLRMANLTRMAVQTSVFQADLLKLTPNMRARITSKSLPGPLTGTLSSTSRFIHAEGRVAFVTITLDEANVASRLLNLEVEVILSDAK